MCLSSVTWAAKSIKNPKSREKWQVGYKVMEIAPSTSFGYNFPFYTTQANIHLNEVMKATAKEIYHGRDQIDKYITGYHLFKTVNDAATYTKYYMDRVIFKVEYRKIVVEGKQHRASVYLDTIVALEMRFIEIIKKDEYKQFLPSNEQEL